MHPSHRFTQYILHLASALGCARFTESTTSLTFRLLAASSAALTGGAAVLPPSPAADERTPLLRDNRRSRVTWPTVSYVCAGCSTGAAFESNLYAGIHVKTSDMHKSRLQPTFCERGSGSSAAAADGGAYWPNTVVASFAFVLTDFLEALLSLQLRFMNIISLCKAEG